MRDPAFDDLGPVSQVVWAKSWDCEPLSVADLLNEAGAMERRRTEPHLCVLHDGGHLANVALVARPRTELTRRVHPAVWVDVCWDGYAALRAEGAPG